MSPAFWNYDTFRAPFWLFPACPTAHPKILEDLFIRNNIRVTHKSLKFPLPCVFIYATLPLEVSFTVSAHLALDKTAICDSDHPNCPHNPPKSSPLASW